MNAKDVLKQTMDFSQMVTSAYLDGLSEDKRRR